MITFNYLFRHLLVCIALFSVSGSNLLAQTIIFSENMGVPAATTLATSYTGWQNAGSLTFSNGQQAASADVRTTNASSNYPGASGGGNVFYTGTSATNAGGFSIEGINVASFRNLTLDFAYRKESSSAFPNFSVDYWDGTAWVTLGNTAAALFNEAANAAVGWYPAKTISLPAAAQINGLKLRFVRNTGGTITIRIDDVILTGTPAVVGSCGSNVSVSSSVTASCGPASVNLSVASGPLVPGASWVWYSGSCGGTRIGTGATITGVAVNSTTSFFVRSEGGICGTSRSCETVTVNVTPIPTMTVSVLGDTTLLPGKTTTLIATATPASTGLIYTWKKDGVNVSGASGSSLIIGIDELGTYTVSALTTTGCSAISSGRKIAAASSEQAWISPNPTNGPFKVRYYSAATVFNFSRILFIFDQQGKLVFSKNYPITGPYSSMDVNFSGMGKGTYYVFIGKTVGERIAVGKLIVQ
jgi:Ig-like domain CHU_C associated